MKRGLIIGSVAIVLGIIGIAAFIPVHQERIISYGVDSYNTHRALFGDSVFRQEIASHREIAGIGFILADLRRTAQLSPVTVRIRHSETQEILVEGSIDPQDIKNDRFAQAHFSKLLRLPEGKALVEFSAPRATNETAIGVRFDPSPSSSLRRYENSNEQQGIFAHSLIEQVPLWLASRIYVKEHAPTLLFIATVVGIALVLGAVASEAGWQATKPKTKRAIHIGIVASLLALVLNTQLYVMQYVGGVSGGDPYNYLFISRGITEGRNPFSEKRLPGYPLLLIPLYLADTLDHHAAMRSVSAISGLACLFVLFLIARALRLPWTVQFLAPALLGWQKDFFITSLRPEPYTFYTLLLLTALLLWFHHPKRWQQVLFGVVLGYAALTRQEGFVLAVVLGTASLFQTAYAAYKQRGSALPHVIRTSVPLLSRMYMPALLIVLPFFISNTVLHRNPFFTPYFEGERLEIVDSAHAFWDAKNSTMSIFTSMWKPAWDQLERIEPYDGIWFLVAFFGVIGWYVVWQETNLFNRQPRVARREDPPRGAPSPAKGGATAAAGVGRVPVVTGRRLPKLWLWPAKAGPAGESVNITLFVISLATCLGAALLIWQAVMDTFSARSVWPQLATGILYISPVFFLRYTGWRGLLIAVVAISQALIALWFHPYAKHYQQVYPFIALAITTTLFAPLYDKQAAQGTKLLATASLLIIFILPSLHLFERVNVAIDDMNAQGAYDSVAYRAVRLARTLPGLYGFDEAYLPAELYFADRRTAFFYPAVTESSTSEEDTWLARNNIRTLVVTNGNGIMNEVRPDWEEIASFKSEGKDERLYISHVYRVHSHD